MPPFQPHHFIRRGSVREYQVQLKDKLSAIFPGIPVEIDWAAMSDERAK